MSSTSKKDGYASSQGRSRFWSKLFKKRPSHSDTQDSFISEPISTTAAPEFSCRERAEPFRDSSVRESVSPESHSESISPSISSNLFIINLPETIEYLSAPSRSLPLPSSGAALLPINETALLGSLASSLPSSSATMSINTGQHPRPVEQTTNPSPSLALTNTPTPPPAINTFLVPVHFPLLPSICNITPALEPSLPMDLWHEILSFAGSTETLRVCCLVCSEFRSIAWPFLYHSVNIRKNPPTDRYGSSFSQKFLRVLKNHLSYIPLIKEIHIDEFNALHHPKATRNILSSLHGLKLLRITDYSRSRTVESWARFTRLNPTLYEEVFPTLSNLILEEVTAFSMQGLSYCPSLRYLRLQNTTFDVSLALKSPIPLDSLDMRDGSRWNPQMTQVFASSIKDGVCQLRVGGDLHCHILLSRFRSSLVHFKLGSGALKKYRFETNPTAYDLFDFPCLQHVHVHWGGWNIPYYQDDNDLYGGLYNDDLYGDVPTLRDSWILSWIASRVQSIRIRRHALTSLVLETSSYSDWLTSKSLSLKHDPTLPSSPFRGIAHTVEFRTTVSSSQGFFYWPQSNRPLEDRRAELKNHIRENGIYFAPWLTEQGQLRTVTAEDFQVDDGSVVLWTEPETDRNESELRTILDI